MSKPNTSATGGIVLPHPQVPTLLPGRPQLTLVQFIQTLLVGLSALPATLVRPSWQLEEPKDPDVTVDWIAFAISNITPDANAYQGIDEENVVTLQRQETLEIALSVYGPAAQDNITLIRDGFQIPQNSAALLKANMGFAHDAPARHVPDYFGGRWIDRYTTEIFLRRYVQREYPILTFLSATGVTYTQTASGNFQQGWQAGGE